MRFTPFVLAAAAVAALAPSALALRGLGPAVDNLLGAVVTVESPTKAQKRAIRKINAITEKAFRGESRKTSKCIKDVQEIRAAMGNLFESALGGESEDEFDAIINEVGAVLSLLSFAFSQDENVSGDPTLGGRLIFANEGLAAAADGMRSIEDRLDGLRFAAKHLEKIEQALP